MTTESDDRVWRRVVEGDARSFGVVWDRHHLRVARHLGRAGALPFDVDDLTAATFLELWRRRSDVRFVDGSLLPWLLVTARNLQRNSVRARRRYDRFLRALPPPEVSPDHAEDVVGRLDAEASAVRSAVAGLSARDADLLAMTALEHLTVREAAAALGLSESAAKMRLSRLRSRLRHDLHDLLLDGES